MIIDSRSNEKLYFWEIKQYTFDTQGINLNLRLIIQLRLFEREEDYLEEKITRYEVKVNITCMFFIFAYILR